MLKNLVLKNVVAVMAAGGVLALTQLAGPALVTSSPSIAERAAYPPKAVTDTDLSLDRNRVKPGEENTAHASVTSDEATPQGTVTFHVQGHAARTVALVNGKASYSMPRDLKAGHTYKVTARYKGNVTWKPSGDSAYVTVTKRGSGEVLGEEGERGDGNGSANRGTPSGDVAGVEAEGGLPDTGSDGSTQLYALGGLGLLAAGAFSLLMHRRRSHG